MDATRLSIGAALVVGAVITAATVWFSWPSGPSSRDMIAMHQSPQVDGWIDEPVVERLHARWSAHLDGRLLPVTAHGVLTGGALVHTDPLWLYMRWQGDEGPVSVFFTPVDHDRQPGWSCKSAQRVMEVCQRTHQGWHVVMVRGVPTL